MDKFHVTLIALLLGAAAALGVSAATHTPGLRATTANAKASNAVIAARAQELALAA